MKATMFRRLTCLILVLALLTGMSISVFGYTSSNWAREELAAAQEAGIIPDNLLEVDLTKKLTRQEMCDIIVHTFELLIGTSLYPSSTNHFTDTTDTNVCIAAELGIVDGYPDGTFRPGNMITRQEYAKVVAGFYQALGWSKNIQALGNFSDAGDVSGWAEESAAIVVELNIVQGNANGTLAPQSSSSRQETLVQMLRIYEFLLEYLQPEKTVSQPTEAVSAQLPAQAEPEEGNTTQTAAATLPKELAPAAAPQAKYTCSTWAEEEMAQLVAYGLMPESLLREDLTRKITRQEICYAAVLLYETVTNTTGTPESTDHFTDTSDATINLAYELGIIGGFPDGTFGPNQEMTRQQLFKIIANLLAALEWEKPSVDQALAGAFADADSISGWAKESAALMYELGIIKGDNKGNMNPAGSTTREEGIVMFLRAYNYISPWYEAHPLGSIEGPLTGSSKAEAVVKLALSYVGYPYVYGGASPQTGFDCSGFTYYIYKQFGYTLNRTAAGQIQNGINVEQENLMPGDIIIMSVHGDITTVGHVAIYIGDGKMVHAQSSATGVCITPVSNYNARYITARRIIY